MSDLPQADFPIESTEETWFPAFRSNQGKRSSLSLSKVYDSCKDEYLVKFSILFSCKFLRTKQGKGNSLLNR